MSFNRPARPKQLVLALTLALSLGSATFSPSAFSAPAFAQAGSNWAGTAIRIELAAQPLAQALNEWARQTRLELIVSPALVTGRSAPAVAGTMTPREALERLLAGSGLAAARDGNAVIVRPASQSSGPAVLPAVGVTATLQDDAPSETTGAYTVRSSRGATGLALSPRETPQSISVITRAQMDDFKLNSINDTLDATPGVVVEKVETDRTYYTARGFNITTFQEDGVGVPFTMGLVGGDIDTALYDRVEVVRGANGLLSNTGNPSATVNLVRKRPTSGFQAAASLSYGSWNAKRIDADVAGALNASGSLRGRLVAALEDKDSYLDRYSQNKNLFYGVLEADLGERTTISLGHTYQANRSEGQLWGGLPLYDDSGRLLSYSRSTSSAADWTYLDTTTQLTFIEAVHRFDNDWEGKAVYTHKDIDWRGKLHYVGGVPDSSGNGLVSSPSKYKTGNIQDSVDVRASGPFELGGRRHELILGASWSLSEADATTLSGAGSAVPPLQGWDGNIAEPAFTADGGGGEYADRQRSLYAATRLNLADPFKLILGVNATHFRSTGSNYGVDRDRKEDVLTPYAGAVYDINEAVSAYASYTEIFNPQSELDAQLRRLDPVTGSNIEGGLKFELLQKRLYGSVSAFRSKQDNLASYVTNLGTIAVYEGTKVRSQGVELELSGNLTERLQMSAGYTKLAIKDDEGESARLFTPRQIFRLSTTWRVPGVDKLKLGANLNWRSRTSNSTTLNGQPLKISQSAYTLVNLMAHYDISDKLFVAANLNNLTNEKYLTSRYWADQGYYGAPRNATVSLNWKY